jgi:hypothetical protein
MHLEAQSAAAPLPDLNLVILSNLAANQKRQEAHDSRRLECSSIVQD